MSFSMRSYPFFIFLLCLIELCDFDLRLANWPWNCDLGVYEKLFKGGERSFVKDCEFEEFRRNSKGEFLSLSASFDLWS